MHVEEYDELCEMSFYPPEDDRMYVSGVYDVIGGDCFAEYAEWFWDEYEEFIFD